MKSRKSQEESAIKLKWGTWKWLQVWFCSQRRLSVRYFDSDHDDKCLSTFKVSHFQKTKTKQTSVKPERLKSLKSQLSQNVIMENLTECFQENRGFNVLLAPMDSSIDGLHLPKHGKQQRRFPTTHLAYDHCQLTWRETHGWELKKIWKWTFFCEDFKLDCENFVTFTVRSKVRI